MRTENNETNENQPADISADRITVDPDTGNITLNGNVRIRSGNIEGDSIQRPREGTHIETHTYPQIQPTEGTVQPGSFQWPGGTIGTIGQTQDRLNHHAFAQPRATTTVDRTIWANPVGPQHETYEDYLRRHRLRNNAEMPYQTTPHVLRMITADGDIFAKLDITLQEREEDDAEHAMRVKLQARSEISTILSNTVWPYTPYESTPHEAVVSVIMTKNILSMEVFTEDVYRRKFPQRTHFQSADGPTTSI